MCLQIYMLQDFPSSDIVEETMYAIAAVLVEEGKTDEAVKRFEDVASKFPGTNTARSAYRKIAKMRKDNKNFDEAIRYFKKVLTDDNNESNAQTQYEIAECVEAKGDLAQAVTEYLKVPYFYSKGIFWAVRAQLKCAQNFERLEKLDEAGKLDEKLAVMNIEESEFAKKRLEWIKWRMAK